MVKQTSLFNQPAQSQTKPRPKLTPLQVTFKRLAQHQQTALYGSGLANQLHVYSYPTCESILLTLATTDTLHSKLYVQLAHRLKPCYCYHITGAQSSIKFHPLNAWLIRKVYNSLAS